MNLWQDQARPLPVTVRPLGGETVISYSRRLSEANDLGPTTVLRALGSTSIGTGRHLLTRDAWLNDHALDRLETYSGLDRDRLARALPALRSSRPSHTTRLWEPGTPFLQIHRPHPAPRAACHQCNRHLAQHPNPVPALVRPTTTGLICRTHRRWLGSGAPCMRGDDAQHDLVAAPEVITAHRRYRRLIDRSEDPSWTHQAFLSTWFMVTSNWANLPRRHNAFARPSLNLEPRWRVRAERLALPSAPHRIPALVTFPEAVALAELLTDLSWRRHVAMAGPSRLDGFFQRIAARFDCAPPQLALDRQPELVTWVETLRYKHRAAREDLISTARQRPAGSPIPFPETCHFK